MRVLLDECLPRRLKADLAGHAVTTVPEAGWAGTKNGDLLRLAAARFDAFVTVDQGVTFQQNLAATLRGSRLGVVVLQAPSNRLEELRRLVPALAVALRDLRPGQVQRVQARNPAVDEGTG
ncbi:MAG TPA: DUF5615 family PIN-like protein [Chloroflexota bacterium]|jgi:predicted nuclease of predicted toxin-antitoxin system|nr:DUF5615 family PIN-like protein [Chloroflexota bacterium]